MCPEETSSLEQIYAFALESRNDYNETIAAVSESYCPDGDCATEYVHITQSYLLSYVNGLRENSNQASANVDSFLGDEDKDLAQWNKT